MGKIELDHTGSGSGITLSSDGTDLLLNGTAIGGGGAALELYAENPSSPTAPSATGTNAVAIGDGASATGQRGMALGYSTLAGPGAVAIGGYTYGAHATGAGSVAIGGWIDDAVASSSYAVAIGEGTNATSAFSLAIGTGAQAVTGEGATALTKSRASGTDSFAAAIANNTSSYGATGANSVAMGYLAKASGIYGVALGNQNQSTSAQAFSAGYGNISSGNTTIALGQSNTASGSRSFVLGSSNTAAQTYSGAIGRFAHANIIGKIALSSGVLGSLGAAQNGLFVLASDTTDATSEALTTDNSTAGTLNQIILPNNSAYAFHGTIVARQQASQGTACAAWKIEGLIRREGSAGTTVLVNSATTVIDNTPSWGMALSADTTNGGLAITVTGAAATNIRWVATIHTSEVTY